MISEDGDLILVFNGEIYNYAALRAQLTARGCRFRSSSDSEVVLHAFREWDTDCFRRFRGMFAIGIWTESRKRLVLARDRVGIKPLFFHRSESDIAFGSEIKAILEHPSVRRQINVNALNCYLSLNYVPGPQTIFEGITKLPPAHFLEWLDGDFKIVPYWRPADIKPQNWTLEDAKQELDRLLHRSVREHLISD